MKNLPMTKIIPALSYFLLGGVLGANLLMSYPVQAQTETIAESMAAHNASACASVPLASNCSDAQIAAALPGVVRSVEQTVYSTVTAYRDAVIVQPQLKARLEGGTPHRRLQVVGPCCSSSPGGCASDESSPRCRSRLPTMRPSQFPRLPAQPSR